MDFKSRVREYYGRRDVADRYALARDMGGEAVQVEELRYILTLFPSWEGLRVLDAGGGAGRASKALVNLGADVALLDSSRAMLQASSRALAEQVRLIEGEIDKLPFPDCTFDVVLSLGVMMHLPNPDQVVREMSRVVRPHGSVILGFNNAWSIHAISSVPIGLYQLVRKIPPAHCSRTISDARRWGKNAGLAMRDIHGVGLVAPVKVPISAGRGIPIIPNYLSSLFIRYVELPMRIGNTLLKRLMKELIVWYERPS